MKQRRIAAGLLAAAVAALSACGSDDEGEGGGSAAEGGFAIYDYEANLVAPESVSGTAVSKAAAERAATATKGTVILQEPEPLEIPEIPGSETKGYVRGYYVLRDRPAIEQADVESAAVQVDPTTDQPTIGVQFTAEGQREYKDLTFRLAKRGSTPPSGPGQVSPGPSFAIVVGDEILSILQLGPGTYTEGIDAANGITIVGGFDEVRARELADAIDPG